MTSDIRTSTYQYTTDTGSFQGETLVLAESLVQEYREKDQVDVLYDPASHKRSVLKIEF